MHFKHTSAKIHPKILKLGLLLVFSSAGQHLIFFFGGGGGRGGPPSHRPCNIISLLHPYTMQRVVCTTKNFN